MEHKLSAKASKMRSRFSFSRSTSVRTRASTVSPDTASPINRPRSATSPESPTYSLMDDHHCISPSKGYEFTDEMGYFRPVSPLISRQEIHEDVVADVKHACALLSHSIERGIPAGLSYQSTIPNWTVPNLSGKPKSRPTGKRKPSHKAEKPASLEQHIPVPPIPIPRPVEREPENSKKHDSGVGMNYGSPTQTGRPQGKSLSGTSSTRFYNKPSSSSPSGCPSEPRTRSRSRSPSSAGSIQSEPQQLSTISSNIQSQYNPHNSQSASTDPTIDSPVSPLNETDKKFQDLEFQSKNTPKPIPNLKTKPKLNTISPSMPHLTKPTKTPLPTSKTTRPSAPEPAKGPKAKPTNRFYSGTNATTTSVDSREWITRTFCQDRNSIYRGSIYNESTLSLGISGSSRRGSATPRMGSVSTSEEDAEYPYGRWAGTRGMSYSSTCLADEFKHQENVYSCVVQPMNSPPRKRREKASMLLRRLAGLRMRREGREIVV